MHTLVNWPLGVPHPGGGLNYGKLKRDETILLLRKLSDGHRNEIVEADKIKYREWMPGKYLFLVAYIDY
jgi:hypothetical protein